MSTNGQRQWLPAAAIAGLVACFCLAIAGIAAFSNHSRHPSALGRAQQTAPGPRRTADTSGTPVHYTKDVVAEGEGLVGEQAAKQVAQGMGGDSLVEGATVDQGASGADISVQLQHNDDEVPQDWAASVVVGAITELMRTDQAVVSDVTSSATATGPDREGDPTTTDLGVGAVRLGQVFNSPSDAELVSHVQKVAADYGLTVSDLQIYHPLQSALDVRFVVPSDATIDWTIDQLRTAIVGDSPDVEGILIQLDSTDGTVLLQSGVSYRTGAGDLWFAPGQDATFGAAHGGTPAE